MHQTQITMKKNILAVLILATLPFIGFCQHEVDTIKLFYLGGQSNMNGYGYNDDLPEPLNKTFDNVWIFQGNPAGDNKKGGGLGKWELLQPGHGKGFKSDGIKNNLSNRFGVELSFAKRLQELYPNEKIALVKYAKGGSSIDSVAARKFGCWEPDYKSKTGINQYDHFLTTLKKAVNTKDIDGNGQDDYLVPCGIIWMQGESDAFSEEIAFRYYSNLKRVMDLMRAALHEDDLPVVLGKISDSGDNEVGKVWEYGELIQYAQEKFAKTDVNSTIVRSTKYYNYSDKWHYNSEGYIDLGAKFAEAVYLLKNKDQKTPSFK